MLFFAMRNETVGVPYMRDKDCSVYSNRLGCSSRKIRVLDFDSCCNQSGQTKADTRRHSDLTKQVEPARQPSNVSYGSYGRGLQVLNQSISRIHSPRGKGTPSRWSEHCCPEVGSSTCRNSRDDLSHGDGDKHGEERDNNPSYAHHARTSRVEAVTEQGSYACNDTDDAKGHAKVVSQTPISPQFLLVAKLGQAIFIVGLASMVGGPAFYSWLGHCDLASCRGS